MTFEEEMFTKYPMLYLGSQMTIQENLMPFGFECGQGWHDIIRNLSEELEKINREITGRETMTLQDYRSLLAYGQAVPMIAEQVKEKYGELRFYLSNSTDRADELIREAEKKSLETCEQCGKPGKVGKEIGWVKTFCDSCRKI